ncbi:MAG TPA: ABC transporter ATP-binding protein [Chloroflexota bacterium]|nr:ABC transporter ATP-binding protein [Chloroflexota bacterium]
MSAQAVAPQRRTEDSGKVDNVLEVEDLHVHFETKLGTVRAVNGVSFAVPRGKVLGVVGESGCGKSMTTFAVMQLVPAPGKVTQGTIRFRPRGGQEVDLLRYDRSGDEMRRIRGRHIGMIFQEPMTALNPCYTIGDQIMESILLHQTRDKRVAQAQALEVMSRVGLPSPRRLLQAYPHQLSGGMRQRAMIALALCCRPDLLLADEPTTALDVTTQAQILDVMRELQAERGMSILFVTHNLGVVAQMCDEVVVMYLGQVVERAPVVELFDHPKHPYTQALLRSIPQLGRTRRGRLHVIQGGVPGAYAQVRGCPFHPRCPAAMPGLCDVHEPQLRPATETAAVSCFLYHRPDGTPVPGPAVAAASGIGNGEPDDR